MDNFIKIKDYADNLFDHQKITVIESTKSYKLENISNKNSLIADSTLKKIKSIFQKVKNG